MTWPDSLKEAMPPEDRRQLIAERLGVLLTELMSFIADELQSHENDSVPLLYRSSAELGFRRDELGSFFEIALQHAQGERKIPRFDFPFKSSELTNGLLNLRSVVLSHYLDVPEFTVPRHDAHANIAWGQLVEKGVDPLRAREAALEQSNRIRQLRKENWGRRT